MVFWVVTPRSDVVGYQHDTPPKCWYHITSLHSVTTQKTMT